MNNDIISLFHFITKKISLQYVHILFRMLFMHSCKYVPHICVMVLQLINISKCYSFILLPINLCAVAFIHFQWPSSSQLPTSSSCQDPFITISSIFASSVISIFIFPWAEVIFVESYHWHVKIFWIHLYCVLMLLQHWYNFWTTKTYQKNIGYSLGGSC